MTTEAPIQEAATQNDHERRFGGLNRLYGSGTQIMLRDTRVAVVGVGGVGSWAVEALTRSGIGNITLIDFDQVAVSNINRQIHALDSTLGKAKVDALRERIRDINQHCTVTAIEEFLTEENVHHMVPHGMFDVVIDACDNARAKAALIAHTQTNGTKVIVCGAAGGKSNPLNLRMSDLGHTIHDVLLSRVRKLLRKKFQIPVEKKGKFGVTCIYSAEPSRRSTSCTAHDLNCAGYGSVVTVTASMGFAAASACLDHIVTSRKLTA